MIDFDALVLAPLMGVFGQPVAIKPIVSQPGVLPYLGRGVWSLQAKDIMLENGGVFSTNEPHLGIRLGDFTVPLMQEDQILIGAITYAVGDIVPDGRGGADLMLKQIDPL